MLCGVLLVKFQACQLALWKARQYFSYISTNEQLTRCIYVSAEKLKMHLDEADVVKIMSGKEIEKILMDLRQFLYRNSEA